MSPLNSLASLGRRMRPACGAALPDGQLLCCPVDLLSQGEPLQWGCQSPGGMLQGLAAGP